MIEELQVTLRRIRSFFVLLLLLCPSVAGAQTVSGSEKTGEVPSEALSFLHQVLERYAHASNYHIEILENHELSGLFVGAGIGSSPRPSLRLTIGIILRFAPKKFGLFRSPTEPPSGSINRNCINTRNAPFHLRDQGVCHRPRRAGLIN